MSLDDDEGGGAAPASGPLFSSSSGDAVPTGAAGTCVARAVCVFFARLAAGEELRPLIRQVRAELRRPTRAAQGPPALPAAAPDTGALTTTTTTTEAAAAGLPGLSQGAAAPREISGRDRVFLQRAAKVALMLSVESGTAQEEATRLLCEPVVAQALQRDAKQGNFLALPLPSKYGILLSDRVAVRHARRWGREGRWDVGLQLLGGVAPSAMTAAAAVELFIHAGRWEMALRSLARIPPASWTEIEVSAAVRGLYRATEAHRRTSAAVDKASGAGLWEAALRILTLARDSKVPLGAPSAANDALGLLGADGRQWVMACRLVEGMLLRGKREGLVAAPSDGVRPNVVSVYHMCRALRERWDLALHYASLMISAGDIRITDDREATDRLLQACIRGHRWAEALRTVQQSLESNLSRAGNAGEDCVRTEVFLHVLRVLNGCQKGSLATQLLQQPQLSRHFSTDTTGKACNVMLRYCPTIAEARIWLQTLGAKNMSVENESYEHLMVLHAREGDWREALSLFNALLTDPRRQRLYIPSAKAHDAVQYALERAPPPGPSWELSLTLFARMCDLHVPISEVAFQSVVKKCFAQGRTEQAQSLFRFVVRYGVHR
ncbi:uncharacterized protein Tco025E_02588 [Trypanosoma conorhini]|uniref:Uncharacterized protein n=1 Tax=Trypanosoma conorhini TaxID=83891 RepID=A0A3R7NMU0_9TRYP|nr:uncharacterized protein Tco025E_02588 [Trypanosoma conorhini]RNF24299.1 hypothetical protein Tco025E_02588 [Trypanosoma conorhini]